tara:strand:+ start:592 stop:786 length:195 start_codon:yes stop_codon:yes gene_type:complete
MKLSNSDNYLQKDTQNEDLENVRKQELLGRLERHKEKLARKNRDKKLTKDRRNKRRQKAKGYYV